MGSPGQEERDAILAMGRVLAGIAQDVETRYRDWARSVGEAETRRLVRRIEDQAHAPWGDMSAEPAGGERPPIRGGSLRRTPMPGCEALAGGSVPAGAPSRSTSERDPLEDGGSRTITALVLVIGTAGFVYALCRAFPEQLGMLP